MATQADHERTDRAFSAFDLTDLEGYGRFLSAQARAVFAVEQAIDRADGARVLEDWPGRRRGEALWLDLKELGLSAPEPGFARQPSSPAGVLGAVYVLEGSRLGGALLSRTLPPSAPSRFLRGGDPAAWRRLIARLDDALDAASPFEEAVTAARAVFGVFLDAARQDAARQEDAR